MEVESEKTSTTISKTKKSTEKLSKLELLENQMETMMKSFTEAITKINSG